MAADKEWFTVETSSGVQLPVDGMGKEAANKEMASTAARDLAARHDGPLTIVKYTRREIRTFEREVTIKEADISTGAVSPA